MKCKVTDFGFAQAIKRNEKLRIGLGTPVYMAPEIYLKKDYDSKVDIWAIGIIAYVLLTGVAPFPGPNKKVIGPQVINKRLSLAPFDQYGLKALNLKDFIHKCLQKNPNDRPTAAELL